MKIKKIEPKNLLILGICFAFGIIFLFLAEYSGNRKTETESAFSEENYTLYLENRLSHMIEKMADVSEVSVMITLEGGLIYQDPKQTSTAKEQDGIAVFFGTQNAASTDSSQGITFPAVKGVCVVCKGASDVKIRKRILSLVASTLDLNENQIYVTE